MAAATARSRWSCGGKVGLAKRSFRLAGHRTSVALEPEFWTALDTIAAAQSQTTGALVTAVDAGRAPDQPLASLLRLTVLRSAKLTF